MKQNIFKDTLKNVHLSNEAKSRIKAACLAKENAKPLYYWDKRGLRAALIAACAVLLSIGVFATAGIIHFYMELDGNEVNISAGLESSLPEIENLPNRAWNADEDEVMIKLDFAYMPRDLTPNLTANGKWSGTDNSRALTFFAHDLRISDLETVMGGYDSAKEFMAGENKAYLLTSASEIALYNRYLFVLFEDEHLVVEAYVGAGITEDEIKQIADGMTIVETDDVAEAIPIVNEVRGGETDDIPDVFYHPSPEVYRDDLLEIGESAHYEDYFGDHRDITVTGVLIADGISSLDRSDITNSAWRKIEKMIDEDGNFVPYNRTKLDYTNGKFGDSTQVTKKLIVVTVELDGPDSRDDAFAFLQSFSLCRLVENDDGTVKGDSSPIECVIEQNVGLNAGSTEPIYREQISDTTYRIAYIIDDDQLTDELFLSCYFAEIYYSFPVDKIT